MTNQLLEEFVKEHYQKKNPQHKDWETPPEFFKALDDEFHFTLDAAASHHNALCDHYCTVDGCFVRDMPGQYTTEGPLDGLNHGWHGERVFCNPPYDNTLYDWVAKAAEREAEVAVLLLPPSIDTRWFHDFIWNWHPTVWIPNHSEKIIQKDKLQIWFKRGRLRFWHDGKPGMAPRAGNMLAIFRR